MAPRHALASFGFYVNTRPGSTVPKLCFWDLGFGADNIRLEPTSCYVVWKPFYQLAELKSAFMTNVFTCVFIGVVLTAMCGSVGFTGMASGFVCGCVVWCTLVICLGVIYLHVASFSS